MATVPKVERMRGFLGTRLCLVAIDKPITQLSRKTQAHI